MIPPARAPSDMLLPPFVCVGVAVVLVWNCWDVVWFGRLASLVDALGVLVD